MNKVNKYDIEYEIARVYPYTRCDEYSHAWECHQATVYSYYSENLKYYIEGKLTLERINEWLKLPEKNRSINEYEHRHLVQKEDGTYREETDDEFRKRLIEKYRKSEEE